MPSLSRTVGKLIVSMVVIVIALIALVPLIQAAPDATTLTVTTLQDVINPADGKCSLREAMQRAFDNAASSLPNDCPQAPGGFTTIKFAVAGTIVISNGVDGGQLPNIINTVTLQGPITIDMGKADQIVLDVESNGRLNLINMTIKNAQWTAVDSRGELNIANVTFENNGAGGAGGGAIRADGKTVIAGSKFINNRAVGTGMVGGAIRSTWDLSCAGCTFTGNTSDKNGGAIAVLGGRMSIADSTFTGNVTRGSLLPSAKGEGGGAIYITDPSNTYPMTITRSTFSGNYALDGVGGAIFQNAHAALTIANSSFQGNGVGSATSAGSGGAIRNVGYITVKRSMFIANSAIGDGGAISNDYDGRLIMSMVGFVGNNASQKGGAIANLNGSSSDATITVTVASLTGNIASDQGGGIYNHESKYDKAAFRLSVWAGNLPQDCRDKDPSDDSNPPPGVDKQPPIDSKGQNSFGDDSCASNDPEDEKNPDPQLEAPADNGGLVPGMLTQKPKPTSPLVDRIAPANYPTNDPDIGNQDIRGMTGPLNGDGIGLPLFDIGPFELDDATPEFSSLPVAPGPIDLGAFAVGTTFTKTDALKIFNGGAADLTISNVALGGTNPGDFKVSGLLTTLPYLGINTVAIVCTPGATGLRTATLSFTTNDPDHASVSFNLRCTGQAVATAGFASAPDAPGPISESTTLGLNDQFFMFVRETGNAPLQLTNPVFSSNPPGAITLDTAFPINLPNGAPIASLQFTCVANAIGLWTASLSFTTNDPAHPSASYNLNCTVSKAPDKFIATTQGYIIGLGTVAGPYGVAISPDARHVYVADVGDSALAAYSVTVNSTLSHIASYASSALSASDRFTAPLQTLVSPDGQNVYITGNGGDAIAAYTRDADSGALLHLSTIQNGDGYGCFPAPPCQGHVSGLDGAYGMALSPDGKFIYVSSVLSDSVVVLARNKTDGNLIDLFGGPMFRQRYTNPYLNSAYGLAISPDGANLYVTGYTSDSLLTLKRNASTGLLATTQVLTSSAAAGLNGVFRVLISPDGNFVYTAAYDSDSICTFRRNAVDGKLTPLSCNTNSSYLDAASDLALTPDGKHLLATAYNSNGVAVFKRDNHSGLLSFREVITRNTVSGIPPLGGARGIVVNPNGKAAYATGYLDDNIVTLLFGNPKPVISALVPAAKAAGSAAFSLIVNGLDFTPESIVRVNGSNRPTTYLNETQLIAEIQAADLVAAGNKTITVFTPAPGGGVSNAQTFTVLAAGTPGVPAINQVSYQGALAGSGPITIEVQGSDFAPSAAVFFNDQQRTTTFVSSQFLLAQLLADDLAQPGLGTLRVENSPVLLNAPQATTSSGAVGLQILMPNLNPPPGLTGLTPATARSLEPVVQVEVMLNGTGFLPESQVLWNDEERPTVYISPTALQLILSAGDLAMPGVASVKVSNPAPGGGESNVQTFTILDPVFPYRLYLPLIRK